MAKGNHQKAIDYVIQNEKSFSMKLDKHRLIIKALYKKGDLVACLNELLLTINNNFNNITEYQSIYDLHELAVSLLVRLAKDQSLTITTDFVNELDLAEGNDFKPLTGDNLLQEIKSVYASFKRYESYEIDNRTTNYHNLRKNAMLTQLLFKHKLLTVLSDYH